MISVLYLVSDGQIPVMYRPTLRKTKTTSMLRETFVGRVVN